MKNEKIKGMFGSETRADEVLAWLKSQGAEECAFNGGAEDCIYYVDQGEVKIVDGIHSVLFNIVELPRWRAEEDGKYFYINSRGHACESKEASDEVDAERYEVGNYFKTSEEADIYATKFREIFKVR